jgi:hypothetical protein
MHSELIVIYVWEGRAYVPVKGRIPSGLYLEMDPVQVAELTLGAILDAASRVDAMGNPALPQPPEKFWRKRWSPTLETSKAPSWKAMMRTGTAYSIDREAEQIVLRSSKPDKRGRWEWDRDKNRVFPLDTPLEDIVPFILEDIQHRPEVMAPPPPRAGPAR